MTNATARLLEQAMVEAPDMEPVVEAAHVACGLTMVGATGPVDCTCHRSCDPMVCTIAADDAAWEDRSKSVFYSF